MSKLVKKLSNFFSKNLEEGSASSRCDIRSEKEFSRVVGKQAERSSVGKRMIEAKDDASKALKDKGKLFVGGLSYSTTSKGLHDYFSKFGEVIDAVVLKYPDSGKSRGFGFVLFSKVSDAESALRKELHVLDEKIIDVRRSEPPSNTSTKQNNLKVFLGGLPDNISTEVLKQFFGRYGEICKVTIPADKNTKKSRGFGFIWFKEKGAFEKCLAEDFVHLGGRRIHIKKAEPRNHSQAQYNEDVSAGIKSDCTEDDDLLVDKQDKKSNILCLRDNETKSTVSEERGEKDCKNQQLLKDMFLAKLENFNEMNEMKTENESKEFQKLLLEFLSKCSPENSTFDEDFIIFSDSESEELGHSSDEDTYSCSESDISEVEYAVDSENYMTALDDLATKFEESSTLSDLNSSDEKDIQKLVPFKFRDNKGSLFCSLCNWTPDYNSCESFLTHCRTNAHRMRLKERFPKESSLVAIAAEGHKRVGETDSDRLNSHLQTKPAMAQQEIKKQGRIQEQRNLGKVKKQAKVLPNVENIKTREVKGKKVGNINSEKNSKVKNEKNKIVGVEKMIALRKGVSCIQPLSGDEVKCNMCDKVIPKALDFSILMKNVSNHLQSKGHLKKLLETENLLKSPLDKNVERTKPVKCLSNQKGIQGNPLPQKDNNTKDKTPKQKQKNAQEQAPKLASVQAQNVLKQKNIPKKAKKKPDEPSAQKVDFLCVPCNYLSKNIEIFKAHLTSQPHLHIFRSKGVNLDSSLDSFTKCKSCGNFLFGSLYYINKHYSKCSERD